jgi:hypothetical protein
MSSTCCRKIVVKMPLTTLRQNYDIIYDITTKLRHYFSDYEHFIVQQSVDGNYRCARSNFIISSSKHFTVSINTVLVRSEHFHRQ